MFLACLQLLPSAETPDEEEDGDWLCRSGILRHKTTAFEVLESLVLAPIQLAVTEEADAGAEDVRIRFHDDFVDDLRRPAKRYDTAT